MMAANVIHAAHEGMCRAAHSSAAPAFTRASRPSPSRGGPSHRPLEATNEGYALAKIAGLKLCQFYRKQYGRLYHSAMPTNLYGPGDNYHPEHSHVLPALIRKFEEARLAGAAEVTLWGTGAPLREFLHVDDLARAVLFLLARDNPPDWVNVGSGEEVSIRALAALVRSATGCSAALRFDPSMPDGTPRKFCDTKLIRSLGWGPRSRSRTFAARRRLSRRILLLPPARVATIQPQSRKLFLSEAGHAAPACAILHNTAIVLDSFCALPYLKKIWSVCRQATEGARTEHFSCYDRSINHASLAYLVGPFSLLAAPPDLRWNCASALLGHCHRQLLDAATAPSPGRPAPSAFEGAGPGERVPPTC
jgi:hypothetical protein